MKILSLTLVAVLFSQINAVSISDLRSTYNRNDNIRYMVSNNSKRAQFVNIAIEAKLNNQWKEIIGDATHTANIVSIIYVLKQGANKAFTFDPKELNNDYFRQKQVHIRLKVSFRNKMGSRENYCYSKSLLINK